MTQGPPADDPEGGASRPRLEHIDVRITDDELRIVGHPATALGIYRRHGLSNDIRNVIAALFFLAGAVTLVFGPQNKPRTVILGIILMAITAGYFGFRYLSVKAPGFTVIFGQSEPSSTAKTESGAKIFWALLGAVIGGGAVYAWWLFSS